MPATQNDTLITVEWGGTDNLSGIASYDIYINSDGGDFVKMLSRTSKTQTQIYVQPDIEYGFYSVAIDSAGNLEDEPTDFDTKTKVLLGNRRSERSGV